MTDSKHKHLCDTIRSLDPTAMTTAQMAEACWASVPDATAAEIEVALWQVAIEQEREAAALTQYSRCRGAGIRGVVDGGESEQSPG